MFLREATSADVLEVFDNLRDEDRDVISRMGGILPAKAAVETMMKSFPSQVFVTGDGRVAALWIALRRWEGVAELVAYTTTAVETERAGFYRACLRGLEYLEGILGLHKIEATVWGEYHRSIQWLQRLGFEQEGYLRAHGPDKTDATLMGRVL